MATQRPLITMEILQDQVLIVIGKKLKGADESKTSDSEVKAKSEVHSEIEELKIICKDTDNKQEDKVEEANKSICKDDDIKHEDELEGARKSMFEDGIKASKDETNKNDENQRNLQATCEDANEDDTASHVSDKSTCTCNTCKNWESSEHSTTQKDSSEEEACKHTPNEVWLPVAFLTAESEFFNSACSERWGCGKKREIHLVDEEPEIFAIFVFWLFNRKIDGAPQLVKIDQFNWDCDDCITKSRGTQVTQLADRWKQLAKCYILGDMLQAPNFSNAMIGELIDLSKLNNIRGFGVLGSDSTSIRLVVKNTTPSSPLRKIIVDNWIATASPIDVAWNRALEDSVLWELYREVAMGSMIVAQSGQRALPAWAKNICQYHVHPGQSAVHTCLPLPHNADCGCIKPPWGLHFPASNDGW